MAASRRSSIALFWIFFPILFIIISFALLVYLDFANGPLYFFIAECVILVTFLVTSIIFRRSRFLIRMTPWLALILVNCIIVPFAKTGVYDKSIATYSNPVKTEVMPLANGDVIGVYNKDKTVRMYAGIPYAEAPIGDLRWKPTVEVGNWEGVKDCTKFAPMAMQPATNQFTTALANIYAQKMWYPDWNYYPEQKMSEDCLYLNIWRPNTTEINLPILVYIHGGSLTSGSSAYEDYNGEEMAKKGVIMITIAYRLGVFGYLAHPDLLSESGTTGNYGLLDQIEALKWVNKNAPYFGGDKNNITIAGESAGSSSVSALCTSPLAKDLFKRAIGESSSLVEEVTPPHTFRSYESACEVGVSVMSEFNCSTIEELRKVPATTLVKTKSTNSGMTLDNYALTKMPYEVYAEHNNNEQELLNGYNVKEADAFVIPQFLTKPTSKKNILERLTTYFDDEAADAIVSLYADEIEKDAFKTFNEIISVYWFIKPHHTWSNMARDAGVNVYRYQFTKENKYHGTYHAGEMVYAYGNVKKAKQYFAYDKSDKELSDIMLTYWSNFAKNGNPNDESDVLIKDKVWPVYDPNTESIMELGKNVTPIADKYSELYPILTSWLNRATAE